MLFNYLKVFIRQLIKNKTFSFISALGLTLGFLCFILLALYIHDELSFDLFHRDADRTFRLVQHEQQEDGAIRNVATVAAMVGKEAGVQYQEVDDICRITVFGRVALGNDPLTRNQEPIYSADPNFFTFFDFPLIEGDPKTVLQNPDAIVISETLAKKYFGSESAVGEQIWSAFYRDRQPVYLTVAGVMMDVPKKSHLQIPIIFSEATWPTQFTWYNEYVTTDWTSNSYVTYLKVRTQADVKSLAGKVREMVRQHYPNDREFKSEFSLQPLAKIHMYSDNIQGNDLSANGIKPFYLYMFGAVGMLLLLIACLNYMNLSTAAAFKRTREIGTRKALGAQRSEIIRQFLADSLALSAVSLLLALLLAESLLPFVNEFTEKELSLRALPIAWMSSACGVALLAGIVSALYPAFIATGVSTAEALKKEIKFANRTLPVRKVLLVAQFTISIIMIASTLVIYRQLKYVQEKDLGFDRENLLVIDINSDRLRRNFETVKAEFSKAAEVLSISTSTRVPGEWKSFPVATVNAPDDPKGREMIFVGIDRDFLKTYGIQLLEGRAIGDPVADSMKIVLTQLAAEQLGLPHPIGQTIEIPAVRFGGNVDNLEAPFRVEVIGIVENFHFESLRAEMMPVIFGAPNTTIQRIDYYTLRVKTDNWDETIGKLKAINSTIDADNPLEYTFLDSRFEEFYQADAKRGQIFLVFSVVIVVIACLGLFALVSYSVESRTKEIGVRKVLGASVSSIVGLVSKEFLSLVLIAGLIAMPVAWYFMNGWLQDFAYRVNPGVGTFVLAAAITLVIAFVTISFRSLKAAIANPVDSLRTE